MINVQELVPEFRRADAQAYVETYPFETLQYQAAFPLQFQPTLKWSAVEAQFGAKVMASVVDFNSRAPRFGRNLPTKIEGDMPKLEIARDKVETDFNTLRELEDAVRRLPSGPTRREAAQRVLDWHYEDQVFVRNGVEARNEWLAKRIASTGKYKLTQVNNEQGIQSIVDVDFAIPAANNVNASVDWNSPTADIIGDIKKIKRMAKLANLPEPRFMWCEQETIEQVAQNPGVQKFTATYVANALGLQQEPGIEEINRALRAKGLPVFKVWESVMVQESKNGNQTVVTGWEKGVVTFSVTEQLGNTQHTTSADEYVAAGVAQKTKSGIVLIKTWGVEDPITVITKGTAYCTPTLNNSKSIFLLKTILPGG
ncbi:major capsid protein [Sphingobacterium psychroaquaticum]|uniref:Phage major capsid protein E n=1 Tax=Sphingobacterium psychroaquaticum TaxID=561061 RepID=A0A1X7JVS4_9SPHI|nr:major capsid protein [Sphingobacterium psychroaquaticum]SMG32176.1 Phage major capsid protein E [Sphingobacterium psychroaquaticum]